MLRGVYSDEQIARVIHEANRAMCAVVGDTSQVTWEEAEEWQRAAAIAGVRFYRKNPLASSEDNHAAWMSEKENEGWTYGPTKDPEKKTHPDMVPYDKLGYNHKMKDRLVRAICQTMMNVR